MKLLIVSHTPHYRRNNELVGWGPTVREIDQLANIFHQVVHIAPLHGEPAPKSAMAYRSRRVQVHLVPRAGGERLWNKLSILTAAPSHVLAMLRQFKSADVVHIRCPASISLLALLLLSARRHPARRWIKYAGNWSPGGQEPWSYAFQRWWLRKGWHRGVVTVNGQWDDQPEFIHAFFNPCLNEQEQKHGRELLAIKRMQSPTRLIFVGRLDQGKGVARVLRIIAELQKMKCPVTLDLIGDGEERSRYERLANTLGVARQITFHGWQSRTALVPLYARAHLILLPSSSSEGWPKVLSEAMAFGAVPVASNVSSIPQYLRGFAVGKVFPADDTEAFARAVKWYSEHPDAWKNEAARGVEAAAKFTYAHYLKAVGKLLQMSEAEQLAVNGAT